MADRTTADEILDLLIRTHDQVDRLTGAVDRLVAVVGQLSGAGPALTLAASKVEEACASLSDSTAAHAAAVEALAASVQPEAPDDTWQARLSAWLRTDEASRLCHLQALDMAAICAAVGLTSNPGLHRRIGEVMRQHGYVRIVGRGGKSAYIKPPA